MLHIDILSGVAPRKFGGRDLAEVAGNGEAVTAGDCPEMGLGSFRNSAKALTLLPLRAFQGAAGQVARGRSSRCEPIDVLKGIVISRHSRFGSLIPLYGARQENFPASPLFSVKTACERRSWGCAVSPFPRFCILDRGSAMETTVEYLEGVKFSIGIRGHKVICDQPVENHGTDTGIAPPEFMLASLGSCAA